MTSTLRTVCGGCGFDQLEAVLDLGATPLANAFPTEPSDGTETRYPLGLVSCRRCTLVQSLAIVSDDLVWGGDYGFYTGTSRELVTYFARYADWALDHFWPLQTPLVVEVGCNDGTLLGHFTRHAKTVGVDPAVGPTEQARGKGLDVITDAFGLRAAERIVSEYGPAGLVIANNVAAHVADLDDFFRGIVHLMAPTGAAVIEVQYLPDLLAGNGVDLVYHEHRSFFSGTSLGNVAGRYGLRPVSYNFQPTQGGSLRVVFCKDEPFTYPTQSRLRADLNEHWLTEPLFQQLQGRADRVRKRLRDMVESMVADDLRIAAYGAPAKATTLMHWAGLDVHEVRWAEDTTPAKWGRYIPGTAIPIHNAEGAPEADVYLLTIHNYAREIVRRELSFLARGGRFLLPLPVPQVI